MNHLAIIADGNRRWAAAYNLPKAAGYYQGLLTIERIGTWAIKKGIKFITLYCFSTENWSRPKEEIDSLKDLATDYFDRQGKWYLKNNIKTIFSGRKDRLDAHLLERIERLEDMTKDCDGLNMIFCIDYGGRDEIVRAIATGARTEEELDCVISKGIPHPDAILRTGGQQRLSNFMLWQSAYSELFFVDYFFPELDDKKLNKVVEDFNARKRNYGG